jgi:hypothetical protein
LAGRIVDFVTSPDSPDACVVAGLSVIIALYRRNSIRKLPLSVTPTNILLEPQPLTEYAGC